MILDRRCGRGGRVQGSRRMGWVAMRKGMGWDGERARKTGSPLCVYQAYGQTLVSPRCYRPKRTRVV